MTRNAATAHHDDSLALAAAKMEALKFRRPPIGDQAKLPRAARTICTVSFPRRRH
jgi:hypothetical protein